MGDVVTVIDVAAATIGKQGDHAGAVTLADKPGEDARVIGGNAQPATDTRWMHGEIQITGDGFAVGLKDEHADFGINRPGGALGGRIDFLRLPDRLGDAVAQHTAVEADAFRFACRCRGLNGGESGLCLLHGLRDQAGQGVHVFQARWRVGFREVIHQRTARQLRPGMGVGG